MNDYLDDGDVEMIMVAICLQTIYYANKTMRIMEEVLDAPNALRRPTAGRLW